MNESTLLQDFIAEAEEHLQSLERNLLRLEGDAHNQELLHEIFRSAHTIKGSAEYLGIEKIADLAHRLESLLEEIRRGNVSLSREFINGLMAARDRMASLLRDLDQTGVEKTDIRDLTDLLDRLLTGPSATAEEPPSGNEKTPPAAESPAPKAQAPSDSSDDLQTIFAEQAFKAFNAIEEMAAELISLNFSAEKRDRILKEIDELIQISRYVQNEPLIAQLTSLRDKAQKAASSAESSDLVPELQKIKSLLSPGQPETPLPMSLQKNSAPLCPQDEQSAKATRQEAPPAQEAKIAPIGQKDFLEEDYDRELFGIFLEHLKEQVGFLKSQTADAGGSGDRQESLRKCLDCVKSLRSSANYMDYPSLVEFFENWGKEIEQALEHTSQGMEATFQFMEKYFEGIGGIFPDTQAAPKPDESADFAQPPSPPSDSEHSPAAKNTPASSPVSGEATTPLPPSSAPESAAMAPSQPAPDAEDREKPRVAEDVPIQVQMERPKSEEAKADDGVHPNAGEMDGQSAQPRDSSWEDSGEKIAKHNLRVDTKKIDALMNQVGELVVNRAWFSQLSMEMKDLQRQLQENNKLDQRDSKLFKSFAFRLHEASSALGRVANDLQEGVMKVRMLPIGQLFSRYPRLVRQLAQETEKRVHLEISGEETELDKMVIEEVSDPLVHLIRNAVDHGIEAPAERLRLKKSEEGNIRLTAYHESNHVVIEVADDGMGMDPLLLKKTAMEKGLLTEAESERMTAKDLLALIMKPGFSTAPQVTKTSGRGVGMDVVKKNIEKLNGTIEMDSTPGAGTRFRIKIPLTLAIIQALLVRVGGDIFTIPLTSVVETLRFFKEEITTIEGIEVIHLRHSTIPLIRLARLFNYSPDVLDSRKAFVVIIAMGAKQVGLVVDSLVGEHEVVIKPLVDYLQEKSGFSGATILGDGRISLILDVYELASLALRREAQRRNAFSSLNPGNRRPAGSSLSGLSG